MTGLEQNDSDNKPSNKRLPVRLAIVSHIFPPVAAGTAVRIQRLLDGVSPEDYRILTCTPLAIQKTFGPMEGRLPAIHITLPSESFFKQATNYPVMAGTSFIKVIQRALNIVRIVRREQCHCIIVFTGELIDLPASYLASRITGLPFFAATDDDYTYQWHDTYYRRFAKLVEGTVLRGAQKVIVLNDFLHKEYHNRYGIEPAIVYNPCHLVPANSNKNLEWPREAPVINIVFTGSIYHANFDTFHNLIAACNTLKPQIFRLNIYTAQPQSLLEKEMIRGSFVRFHGCRPIEEIQTVQQQADILFLPLGFDTPIAEVIRTSAPFKMGEYLATGRPILVHAPADSFLSWYFKKHECGLVVNSQSPRELAKALIRLQTDHRLRDRIGSKARQRAEIDFDQHVVQKHFFNLFSAQP